MDLRPISVILFRQPSKSGILLPAHENKSRDSVSILFKECYYLWNDRVVHTSGKRSSRDINLKEIDS